MSAAKFKILFSGELLPDRQLATVQTNLASLFKADPERIKALFSGASVEIKKGLSEAQADQYIDALHRAGAKAVKAAEATTPLSILATEDHPEAPITTGETQHSCPKCGHIQAQAQICNACGIVIEKYVARQTEQIDSTTLYAPPQAHSLNTLGEYDPLNYYTSDGRIGRLRYIAWTLALSLCMALIFGVSAALSAASQWLGGVMMAITGLAYIAGMIVISIKRLHDAGWSGWLLLLTLVPVLGSIFSLLVLVVPGNTAINQYGPPPPANSTSVKILAGLWLVFVAVGIVAAIMLPFTLPLPNAGV